MNIKYKPTWAIFIFLSLSIAPFLTNSEPYSANHEKVKILFKSNTEKTAKDAVWTARKIFKVGVFDNGTPRNGYAMYVCEILYEYGFKEKNIWVQIIDIVKLSQTGDWVRLGQAHCK